MARIRVGDGEIAYDEAGQGLAVVLIHAALGDRRMWDRQFSALAIRHRVIRYDWRGMGESDSPTGEVAHHEDLIGLLDALNIERAVLVGASMGGSFAVDAALAAPGRVAGLVLVCSALSGYEWPPEMAEHAGPRIAAAVPLDRLRGYVSHTATDIRRDDIAAMAEAQADLMVAGPRRRRDDIDPDVWDQATAMLHDLFAREWRDSAVTTRQLDPPAIDRLADITVPTLVINGLEDLPWIQELADLLAAQIPYAQRVDLPNTAHLPSVERPNELNAAVARFFAAASLGTSS